MNCKPGDLALCVRGEHQGKTCDVLRGGETYKHQSTGQWMDGWIISFPREVQWGVVYQPDNTREGWYPDEWLKPIRDPGDDATDETLEWLPVPGKAVTA